MRPLTHPCEPHPIEKARARRPLALGLIALSLLGGASCKGARADVKLSKTAQATEGDIAVENVPVPPENGPKLVALKADVFVLEKPQKSAAAVGVLRFGAAVARAKEPIRKDRDCEGGYYPVRPRGFVCAEEGISLAMTGDAIPAPDTARALPYRYATAKAATPLYARPPTAAEQSESEPDLNRHLAKAAKAQGDTAALRAGANDVPLDERGVATGHAMIARGGVGVDDAGKRTRGSYFDVNMIETPPVLESRKSGPLVAMVLRRGSGVALVATTTIEGPAGPRKFGITPELGFVPIDRLDPALGSTFAGIDLTKEKGLPVAFSLRHGVCPYALSKGKAKRLEDEEIERRTPIFLSNRFRTVDGVRYEEAEDGMFYREKDIIKIVKRTKFPDFVHEGTKWVDVSLALQTMTLYEGKKAVYATLVSTGKDVIGDPATSASTVQGTFTVRRKVSTGAIDSREVDQAFDVLDVPYQLDFAPGAAIVGSYFSEPAGEARGFHNVTLTPVDAHRLYAWAGPEIPAGFRWYAPKVEEAITVVVRK